MNQCGLVDKHVMQLLESSRTNRLGSSPSAVLPAAALKKDYLMDG